MVTQEQVEAAFVAFRGTVASVGATGTWEDGIRAALEAAEALAGPTKALTDPFPYVFQGHRYERPKHGDRAFKPRPEYSQNREDYPKWDDSDPMEGLGLNGGAPRW